MTPGPTTCPVMPGFSPGGVCIRRHGEPISHARFLGQVLALAQRLPDAPWAMNLCEDRYRFLIALCACLVRGIPSLLPSDRLANTILEIASGHPGTLCIGDLPVPELPLPLWTFEVPDAADADPSRIPEVPADWDCLVAFTSGSTGRPQPHPKRWGDLMCAAALAVRRFAIRPESTIVATVPAQHMYGLELSVLVPLAAGAATESGRPFFPEDVRRTLEQVAAPRILVTTPVHLAACAGSAIDWPAIDFVVSAAAPLSPDLARQAESRMQTRVFEIYGCTEAGSMASRRTSEGPAWRWYDTVRASTDAVGTTIAADFLPAPVPLADVLEFDCDGGFRLLGRNRDMVKVAGRRASLADLNLKLNSIPGVLDGVFVAPDDNGPEVGRLAVVAVAPGLDRETLLRELKRLIDHAFLPRHIVLAEALPRNEAGKLPRRSLLDLLGSGPGSGGALS